MRSRLLRIAAALVAVAIVLCFAVVSAAAQDNTYTFNDFGMSVKVPKEFYVITRNTSRGDNVFEKTGLDYDKTMTEFHAAGIYLRAYEPDNAYQLSMTVTKNESSAAVNNYSDLTAAQRKSIAETLLADESVSSSQEVKRNGIIFFETERKLVTEGTTVYIHLDNTIVNGYSIDLSLQKNDNEISSEEAKVLSSMANSLNFKNINRNNGPKFDLWRLLLWVVILAAIAVAVSLIYKRHNEATKARMEARRLRRSTPSNHSFGKETEEKEEAWQMTFDESLGYRDDEEFASRADADEMAGYDIKVRDRDPNKGVAFFEDGGDGIDDGSDYFDTYFKEPVEQRTAMQRFAGAVGTYAKMALRRMENFFINLYKKISVAVKRLIRKITKKK